MLPPFTVNIIKIFNWKLRNCLDWSYAHCRATVNISKYMKTHLVSRARDDQSVYEIYVW